MKLEIIISFADSVKEDVFVTEHKQMSKYAI